ncbi:hypothetical protein HII31_00018, partial [Pseudocercospora fuligena]
LALASPAIVKRDAASITQAIGYIQSNITAVNMTLNTFTKPKDSITAFKIQIQTEALTKSVQNAGNVSSASAPLSDSESFTVASAVLNLQPKINSLLDNVENHKPQFDTAIFGFSASPIVKKDLQDAQKASNDFGNALTPKLSGAYQQAAPIVIKQINDKFNEAIAKFSS